MPLNFINFNQDTLQLKNVRIENKFCFTNKGVIHMINLIGKKVSYTS